MDSCGRTCYFVLVLILFANWCSCDSPEQGIFSFPLDEANRFGGVSKNLQVETEIGITVECADAKEGKFTVEWMVRFTECNELRPELIVNSSTFIESLFSGNGAEQSMLTEEDYIAVEKSNMSNEMTCQGHTNLKDETDSNSFTCVTQYDQMPHCNFIGVRPPTEAAPTTAPAKGQPKQSAPTKDKDAKPAIKRRAAPPSTASVASKPVNATETPKSNTTTTSLLKDRVTKINERPGRYWVLVHVKSMESAKKDTKVTVTIKMKSPSGFLSAYQAPLLAFYGVMCGVYSILTFIWLVMMALQWRDLLRIQFWIGAVMLLGLLEKAVFYAEYENVNKTGISVPGGIIIAELLSCVKRSLARMLVIIVSLGYGITRPRLGRDLHWVLGAGMLYLILSSVESCLRVEGTEQHDMIAILPLAVLDAIICWWIFKSLVDTTRTLRLRRNMVKLWLYRHFTNTLIFCVVAAVIFLLWSTKTHRWTECMKKWNELWLDDAYWHVLFCIILIVIVILFRPTANNQRYAYSPLTDREADDESHEPMLNDAFEGMKMRNVVTNRNESQSSNKVEDDLKWVEDNIPASVADAALGAFDDSEEELVTNLERSKLE
ncbi:transmembrane protein 87A-like [Acanthaster planci]|uniref:Transmembrane protein 87A-like n=1 Tax=Acanthaster planci TaxID=133434 RepID=A0A8B7YQF9_ACAPL|nr:transmembrane protein 87A-like [Acanthaster planci]